MANEVAKQQAALKALEEVRPGMVLGLGTGSTAALFVEALIARNKREPLDIIAIPTSEATRAQAKAGGIALSDFAHHQQIDITFDGADIVDLQSFYMLKGLGGACLREKIVAEASQRVVIMVDESKIPPQFGGIVPVEIVPFGHEATLRRLSAIAPAALRVKESAPFVTDNGNYIADLTMPKIDDAETLERRIEGIAGVVETGLFLRQASRIIVASASGVQTHDRGK
jgi:ribose 5-phosphate isomerase A